MFKTMYYTQWPKDTSFVDKLLTIDQRVRDEFRLKRTRSGFRKWDNSFLLTKSAVESYVCDSHSEFIQVLKTVPYFTSFDWHSTYAPKFSLSSFSSFSEKRYGVGVDYTGRDIEVSVYADDNLGFIEKVHQLVGDVLDLTNPVRVEEDGSRRKMLDPSVFVARHFDKAGNDYYSKLSDFLYLLGFAVSQGEEYSSESIPDKVKKRIEQQEMTVVVVTGDRDHSWLVSEASYALGRKKHLVLMVESNATIETALLGKDREYINFTEGHIEQGFCHLLREFRSVGVKGLFY